MDVFRGFLAARDRRIAPLRRAGADEDRVPVAGQQFLEAADPLVVARFDAQADDVAAFLVDHFVGQAELRNLAAHHAAGRDAVVKHRDLVAEHRQVARHGQRSGTGADAGDAFAVLFLRRPRQAVLDVVLEVGADALQPADGHRLLVHPAATAGRFAGTIANAPQDAGKDIRAPVDHVGIRVAAGGNQADVLGNGGVGRAGPLTIHDLVEIVVAADVRRFHVRSVSSCGAASGSPAGRRRQPRAL